MTYTNLNDSVQKLRDLEDFEGSSFSAKTVWIGSSYVYYVYSYSTIIGMVMGAGIMDRVRAERPDLFLADTVGYFMTERKYSVTTSKHQSKLRQGWNIPKGGEQDEDVFRNLVAIVRYL